LISEIMSTETIKVFNRVKLGTRASRSLRAEGKVPAILYGHGEENLNLSILADEIMAAIRHRAHVVELKGDVNESALLKDVQWGPLGAEVLHVDMTRVSKGEKAEATIAVELHGEPAGVREGGHVDHVTREVQILCPISRIPAQFDLNISHLELEQSILASDLELPEGAELLIPPETPIVQVVEHIAGAELEEEEEADAGPLEPEVIGESEEEGEGSSEGKE
jgi:large subunit ribosomal protein L25